MSGEHYEPRGARARRVEDIVRRVEAVARRAVGVFVQPHSDFRRWRWRERRNRRAGRSNAARGLASRSQASHRTSTRQSACGCFAGATSQTQRAGRELRWRSSMRRWRSGTGPIVIRSIVASGLAGDSDWFTIIGVAPDLQLFGIDPSNSQAQASAFVPYRVSGEAEHWLDSSGGWRPCLDYVRGSRRNTCLGSEHPDVLGPHDGRRTPPELLAVRALRMDLRDNRRRRIAALGGWCLWRAFVFSFTTHAGNRRACSPWRQSW